MKIRDEDIAEIHAKRLEQTHSDANKPHFDNQWKTLIEGEVEANKETLNPSILPDVNILINDPVTVEELEENLCKTKNKASGEDKISNRMLKMGNQNLFVSLCLLYTAILSLGYFPDAWKTGLVIMIAKAQKDPRFSKSFRPITLLSCLSKLLELIILNRLKTHLDTLGITNHIQAGYKKGRSGQEHLLRLVQTTYQAFNNKQSVYACFLDMEAAFDGVWTKGLQYKILKSQLPTYLKKITCDFLRNRRLKVKVNNAVSRIIVMLAGTPQGAVLSPELFKIYTDDLVPHIPRPIAPAAYADDWALWLVCKHKLEAILMMQEALDCLWFWCGKWRLSLSAAKSVTVFFNHCPTNEDDTLGVYIDGTAIAQKTACKFLGVKVDQKLTWKDHTDETIGRSKYKVDLIKDLGIRQRRKFPESLVKFMNILITPIFTYGGPCFLPMSHCHWDKIDVFQTQSLRKILGIPRHVSDSRVLDAAFAPKLSETIRTASLKRLESIMESSPFSFELENTVIPDPMQSYVSPLHCLLETQ